MRVRHVNLKDYGETRLPTLSPPVLVYKDVDMDLIGRLYKELQAATSELSGVFDATGGVHTHTTSTYHRSSSYCKVSHQIRQEMEKAIISAVEAQVLPQLGAQATPLCEALQFLRYSGANSGHFRPHTDSAYYDAHGKFQHTSPNRLLTSLLFVNDGYVGGDLVMNSVLGHDRRPIKIKPEPGMMVVFPSDLRFVHEVEPVTQGERYSVVGWHSITW